MIEGNQLTKNPNNTYSFSNNSPSLAETVANLNGYFTFGEEERFRDEPTPALWTGFLVEKNILLTAAHCVCKGPIQEIDVGSYADDQTNTRYQKNVISSSTPMRKWR